LLKSRFGTYILVLNSISELVGYIFIQEKYDLIVEKSTIFLQRIRIFSFIGYYNDVRIFRLKGDNYGRPDI